jgi:hypothetical protein
MEDSETYAARLAERGVVAVEGYVPADRCDQFRSEIETVLDDLPSAPSDADYGDLAAWDGAVVKQRSGDWDAGMLDVFNIDAAVPGLESFRTDPFVEQVIDEATPAGETYAPGNLNAYVNRSVTATRDYHADTYSGKFKSFLYLTDVPDEAHGPFSYIPGSHDQSTVRKKSTALVNRVRDRPATDAAFYDAEEAVTFTAPRGTLVVANQAGYHRGIPQEPGHERLLVTTSYTPESR